MDALNPLSRWLLAGVLAAIIGCTSDGSSTSLKARSQAPVAPIAPSPVPPGPVPGGPVTGAPPSPDIQKTGYSAVPAAGKGAELLKDAVPQIKVVALVGATNLVTDQEVTEAVMQNYQQLNAVDPHLRKAKEKEMYAVELRKIVARELILDEMYTKLKKAGKSAAIDDIKDYASKAADFQIRMIRKSINTPTEEAFADFLRTQGLTVPVMRRQFERETMAREYIRSVLKDKIRTPGLADIREYYDRHPDQFKSPDKVKWLDIFISYGKHATPRAAYDHAESVRQKAASGADFAALSKEFDNGLSGPANGVGIGSGRNEIKPAEVEPTVWALRAGEVSGLIQTPVGYHIVKVVEREYAGVRPLDPKLQTEIRERLTNKYREVEEQKMIEELWRKGPVRIIEN